MLILIVAKNRHSLAMSLAATIAQWLDARGVDSRVVEHRPGATEFTTTEARGADLVLVLGGDGTFISVARQTLGLGLPLLGVNLGQVGFLTSTCPACWPAALEQIISGGVSREERMVLSFSVEREGAIACRGQVVNDLVVGRGSIARLVRLRLEYGAERVGILRCDGMIIATPTGSTAYSVSAGGPLVHPSLSVYCLTPVAPFRNDFRPLVLPADRTVALTVEEPHGEINLTEDGQRLFALESGDRILVEPARQGLSLVRLNGDSYFKTLADKGFMVERG